MALDLPTSDPAMRLALPTILFCTAMLCGTACASEDYRKSVVTHNFLMCGPAVADLRETNAMWDRFVSTDTTNDGPLVPQLCKIMRDDLTMTVRTINDVQVCELTGVTGLEPSLRRLIEHERWSRETMPADCR